jgi:hypothetical protein
MRQIRVGDQGGGWAEGRRAEGRPVAIATSGGGSAVPCIPRGIVGMSHAVPLVVVWGERPARDVRGRGGGRAGVWLEEQ